jgi:hypothetical protein
MRRAAHPSGCARCGAGAGSSAMKYQSLWEGRYQLRKAGSGARPSWAISTSDAAHAPLKRVQGAEGSGGRRVQEFSTRSGGSAVQKGSAHAPLLTKARHSVWQGERHSALGDQHQRCRTRSTGSGGRVHEGSAHASLCTIHWLRAPLAEVSGSFRTRSTAHQPERDTSDAAHAPLSVQKGSIEEGSGGFSTCTQPERDTVYGMQRGLPRPLCAISTSDAAHATLCTIQRLRACMAQGSNESSTRSTAER